MKHALEICLPILPPLRFGSFAEDWKNTVKFADYIIKITKKEIAALEQIEDLGSYQLSLTSARLTEFDSEKARRSFTSKINRVSRLNKHTSIISDLFINIELELETDAKGIVFDVTTSEGQYKRATMNGEEYVNFLSEEIFRICVAKIEAIYIISQLARPNGITFGPVMLQINEKPLSAYTLCRNPFRGALIELSPFGVPDVTSLALTKAWRWARGRPGFLYGEPTTRVDRALSCFSHLFGSDFRMTSEDQLVWSISGLEALFGEAGAGIGPQISRKWLALVRSKAQEAEFRRKVRKAYQVRSSFLHGDAKVAISVLVRSESDSKTFSEISDAADFCSVALLLALRTLCSKNAEDIDFSYRPIIKSCV